MSVYLGRTATTPLRECALETWTRAQRDLATTPGNPVALHSGGRRARRMLDDACEQVTAALGTDIHEVIFASGATESGAFGVMAAAQGMCGCDDARDLIVASDLGHDAVAHQREVVSHEGFSWEALPVDTDGVFILPRVSDDDTSASWDGRLVPGSVTLMSSEIGTIQPAADFAELVQVSGDLAYRDAAQAIPTLDMSFAGLGLDLLSVGGHKVGAPAGIDILLVRRGTPMTIDRPGGGHEHSIRSGTPDVADAYTLGAVLAEAVAGRVAFAFHAATLRTRLLAHLPGGTYSTVGETASSSAIIHLSLPTIRPEAVLMAFDTDGIVVSAGSAYYTGVTHLSEIVMMMGRSEGQTLGVLYVSLGHETTRDDTGTFLAALSVVIRMEAALDDVAHMRNGQNEESQMRILAALSGDVGSTITAAKVVEVGHDVVGVRMALSSQPQGCRIGSRGCCSIEDAGDAVRAAETVDIPFCVWGLAQELEQTVITDFVAQYKAGRTPSLRVRCNEFVEFRKLATRARALGLDAMCIGHYAAVVDGATGPELHRGADNLKDQSYMLVVMGPEELHRVVLPLGDAPNKAWVRPEAEYLDLGMSSKPDSYGICFIPDGDTQGFLHVHLGVAEDEIVTLDGEVLGRHKGYQNRTVGQRKGLGIDAPTPCP